MGSVLSSVLERSLIASEAADFEAAFQVYGEHSLQIEGSKPKWEEAILPALQAAAETLSSVGEGTAEAVSEAAFQRYAVGCVLIFCGPPALLEQS